MMHRTVVVVGASQGIGKELVCRLAENPENKIIAIARYSSDSIPFSELKNVKAVKLDLSAKDVRVQMESVFTALDTIDVLINNAGCLINKPFMELAAEDLEVSYQVNVLGVMQTVQAAVPKMIEKGGHIVNISSMGGFQGTVKFPGLAAYSTSKAAVASFTELFAEEYKETGIKMNCLCLGSVQTEMLEKAFPGFEALVSAGSMAEYIAEFALKAYKWMHGRIIPVSLTTP